MNTKIQSRADRPLSVAQTLRKAIDLLLDNASVAYNWMNCGQCNCGLLVRATMSIDSDSLKQLVENDARAVYFRAQQVIHGAWTKLAKGYCHLGKGQMKDIMDHLLSIGFTLDDFADVEFLGYERYWAGVVRRDEVDHIYSNRTNVAKYFLEWALEIESFNRAKDLTIPEVAIQSNIVNTELAKV